jgi:hypothetical protein
MRRKSHRWFEYCYPASPLRRFRKLVGKYLNLDITRSTEKFRINLPFTVAKARRGAIIIEPNGPKGIFDLPPDKLKKLVQGVIWRDEHFAGKTLTEIAKREGCPDAHAGKSIMYSFDILQSGQSAFLKFPVSREFGPCPPHGFYARRENA